MPLHHDLRTAFRSLVRSPGFFLTAVLSLAIAIGASAAAFGVVDAVRLRSLPFPDGDRLVVLSEVPVEAAPDGCRAGCDVSYETYANVLRTTPLRSLDVVAGYTAGGKALNLGGEPILVTGGVVSPNLFDLLQARPVMGRVLSPDDDRLGAPPVVVLSHDLWSSRFESDPAIIGRSIRLSDTDYTVIGVMPPGFNHEVRNQFWLATVPTLDPSTRPSIRSLTVIGRLAPGRTLAQLRGELATIDPAVLRGSRPATAQTRLEAAPLRTRYAQSTRSHDLIFAAIVGCILLIAVVNLANLVLVRSLHQQREFAIRSALGARAGRIVREQFVQQLVIVVLAAVVGITLAAWLLKVLASLDTLQSLRPAGMDYRIDGRVIGFTLLLSLLIGGLLSLVPTRVASRADVQSTLRDGGHSATAGRRGTVLQQVFVVAQIALAVILLTGAGLMSRTVIRLSQVNLGFEPEGLIEGTPSFPHPWRVKERYLPVTREIQAQLERLPGVGASVVSASVPLGPRGAMPRITLEGQGEPLPPALVPASATAVTPGYFRALEVGLVRGREFGSSDLENTQPVAIINQWAGAHWWPGADPLGRSFRVDTLPGAPPVTLTVVGVVADHKAAQPNLLLADDAPEIYRPYEQAPSAFPTFYVRSTVDPAPLLKPIRELLARLVPDRPVFASLTAEQVGDQLSGVRVNALQILGFAVVGLGLALMGIYGLLSYAVSRRTQELGVRGALGASRGQLTTLVLVDAIRLTLIGLAIGLPLASVAIRPIQTALYGTNPTDPVVYGVVGVAVLVVTVAASLVPARRASRVDPLVALRS